MDPERRETLPDRDESCYPIDPHCRDAVGAVCGPVCFRPPREGSYVPADQARPEAPASVVTYILGSQCSASVTNRQGPGPSRGGTRVAPCCTRTQHSDQPTAA